MSETQSRRGFLGAASAATFFIMEPQTVRGYQANSALTVGLLGSGRRGTFVSGLFAQNEFARMAALCDIYEDQLQAASQKFTGAKLFHSAEEILASDVDAIYIATPPYLHPQHFEMAVKSRKHIFMEKPAGVDFAGCQRVLAASRAADPTKRISIDYQQRYGKQYQEAYGIVKSGQLGAIKAVRAAWIGGGLPVRSGHAESEEPIRNWLFYKEKGGDIIVEQNCHNIDVVNWFMGKHPVVASGYGGRAIRKQIGNIMDNLAATFQFDDGTVFSYSANQFGSSNFYDVSETFMCENGAITTSRQGYKLYKDKDRKIPPVEVATDHDITKDAVDAFINGARTGKLENAASWAVESTLTAIMAREAIYSGRPKTWRELA